MKKATALVGVVVVLGVAYVGSTWYLGKKTEETMVRVVDDANRRLVKALGPQAQDFGLKIEIASYQRGWFSSDVSYVLHTKDEQGEPFTIALADHVGHGPFPVNALSSGNFMPMLAYSQTQLAPTPSTQKWFDAMKGEPPVNAVSRIGFDTSGASTWNFLPLDYTDEELHAVFSGGTIQVDFSNQFKDSVASGQFASFTLTQKDSDEGVVMSDMRIQGESESTGDGPDDAKITSLMTVDAISVNEDGGQLLLASKFGVSFDSERREKLMDLDIRYDLGSLTFKQQPLGQFSFGFGGKQLDADAFTQLTAFYDQSQAALAGGDSAIIGSAEYQASILQTLVELLASEPKLSIAPIQWKNSAGESLASVEVDLFKPAQDPAAVGLEAYAAQAIRRVKLDVAVSKPMVLQAIRQTAAVTEEQPDLDPDTVAQLYDSYVEKLQNLDFAVVENDIAKSTIVFENNGFIVNGKEVSLPEFMMRGMMLAQ
jgi:uncharacterized protein YdgA (DUF945 family)